jgi:class 3 adenylate cyclase
MFSDLVGSTALSARMDPEDLREVISGYQKCVAETVQRFGGFVAKYMGDDSTRKLVGSLFELEDLGAQDLATGRERRYQHVCLGALSSQASQKRAGIVQIGCIKTLCELIVD